MSLPQAGAFATVKGDFVSNSCAFVPPVGAYFASGYWRNANGSYMSGNTDGWNNLLSGATNANPFYFDADVYHIKCLSFPDAGDSTTLFGINAQILAHTAAIANLQSQVTALTPAGAASAAGGVMTSEIQIEYFGAVLAFLVVVWLGDRVRRFFWRSGGDHV